MTSRAPSPISPEALRAGLSERLLGLRTPAVITVDGAPAANPAGLGADLVAALQAAGRAAVHIEARFFWRDASVRLEYGREDVDGYLDWTDGAAIHREVIGPLRSGREILPSLRDPDTNRATRAQAIELPDGVVVISGAFLLRLDPDPDLSIHLAMSPGALERHTPQDLAWSLPAFERYERDCAPSSRSDVVVRCDDPRHPAVLGLR